MLGRPTRLCHRWQVFKDVDASLTKVVQTAERELEYEDQNKVYKSARMTLHAQKPCSAST